MDNYTKKQQAAKGASSPHARKIHSLLASFATEEEALLQLLKGSTHSGSTLVVSFEHTLKDFDNVPHLQTPCHPAGDKFHQTFSTTYNYKHQTLGPFHPTMWHLQ